MADEAIRTLQEKNIDPTIISRKSTCHEKDVVRAYERLNQSDFQLKRSYKKIEELHKKDKSHKKAELIKHEEENFDKLYSDLKCQQANMQKCLKDVNQVIFVMTRVPQAQYVFVALRSVKCKV